MSRIVAIANHKGGVGKTTTAVNLAHALVGEDTRVLLCDLDPQASLTKLLGFDTSALPFTVYDLLMRAPEDLTQEYPLLSTTMPGVTLLPASGELANIEMQLVSRLNRERTLSRVLRPLSERFTVTLLDCPPALNLLATMALAAADEVLIPVASEFLALQALRDFLDTVEEVRRELNPNLKVAGIVITQHEAEAEHNRGVMEALREAFGSTVFDSMIPYSVTAKDSVAAGQSILEYDPESSVAAAYRGLAHELTIPNA